MSRSKSSLNWGGWGGWGRKEELTQSQVPSLQSPAICNAQAPGDSRQESLHYKSDGFINPHYCLLGELYKIIALMFYITELLFLRPINS